MSLNTTYNSSGILQQLAALDVQREQMQQQAKRQLEQQDAAKAAMGITIGGLGTGLVLNENMPAIMQAGRDTMAYGPATAYRNATFVPPTEVGAPLASAGNVPPPNPFVPPTADVSGFTPPSFVPADAAANVSPLANTAPVLDSASGVAGQTGAIEGAGAIPGVTQGATEGTAALQGAAPVTDAAGAATSTAAGTGGMTLGQVAGPLASAASIYSLASSDKARKMPGNYMTAVGGALSVTPLAPVGWAMMAGGTVANLFGWRV